MGPIEGCFKVCEPRSRVGVAARTFISSRWLLLLSHLESGSCAAHCLGSVYLTEHVLDLLLQSGALFIVSHVLTVLEFAAVGSLS